MLIDLYMRLTLSASIGPVAQYHHNSKFYSAKKPQPNSIVDANLPHITIEMPVYKESLTETMYVLTSRVFHSI